MKNSVAYEFCGSPEAPVFSVFWMNFGLSVVL